MQHLTHVLVHALLRATFGMDLDWQSPGEGFRIEGSPAADRLTDAFRFDKDGPWIELRASATSSTQDVPQIQVRGSIPAGDLDCEEGFRLANDINRRGLAPVYYDAPTGTLVVQQAIVFSGYHDVGTSETDAGVAFAQREATLNMLVAFFGACGACVARVRADDVPGAVPMRRIPTPSSEVLELFSTFVLARMFRHGHVRLAEGSLAFEMVRRAASQALMEETLLLAERGSTKDAACRRIDHWMQASLREGSADAAHFDAILFDVDRTLRWKLRDVMPHDACKRPLSQLALLEQALAVHGDVWQAVRVIGPGVAEALAAGLDLEPADVPSEALARILARFPFLAE